jgi:hypothetical protein
VLSDIEILAKCTRARVVESSQWTTIVNSAEDNSAKFCIFLDGKPLYSILYGMYTITLNKLQAVLKVNTLAGQNGAMNETSLESTSQDDDFQEVKRCKRYTSNETSEAAKKRPNQSHYPQLSSRLQKQCQLATSSRLSELLAWTRGLLEERTH